VSVSEEGGSALLGMGSLSGGEIDEKNHLRAARDLGCGA